SKRNVRRPTTIPTSCCYQRGSILEPWPLAGNAYESGSRPTRFTKSEATNENAPRLKFGFTRKVERELIEASHPRGEGSCSHAGFLPAGTGIPIRGKVEQVRTLFFFASPFTVVPMPLILWRRPTERGATGFAK